MIFASTELGARIEAAERDLVVSCVQSAAIRHPELRTLALPLGGGAACFAGADSPLDKVVGLGFADAPTDDELFGIERAYAALGCPVQIELSTLADPTLGPRLSRRGYVLQSFEHVLACPLASVEPRASAEIEVSRSDDAELSAWLATVVRGFGTPDDQGVPSSESFADEALERVIGDMASAPGFERFLARRQGAIAGGASLRMGQGIAQLCGASTLPEHRRRGVQTALLDTRLAHAARSGCELAVVTTMPGSRSQHNAQRRGFELLYARAILVRPPGA